MRFADYTFCRFVFPESGQIFRRRQERAINRRPEKLMNNARRRESGHSRDGDRWYPFISMLPPLSPPHHLVPTLSPSQPASIRSRSRPASGRLRSWRRAHFPLSACIMNVCHIRRLISVCPPPTSRRNVCRDVGQIALSISDACSASSHPPFPLPLPTFSSLSSSPILVPRISSLSAPLLRLDGIKRATPCQHVPLIFHSRIYISYFRDNVTLPTR